MLTAQDKAVILRDYKERTPQEMARALGYEADAVRIFLRIHGLEAFRKPRPNVSRSPLQGRNNDLKNFTLKSLSEQKLKRLGL